ncbi:MAG: hypothetical protein ACRC8Y_10445 [Chroococcales cyanobacterium]
MDIFHCARSHEVQSGTVQGSVQAPTAPPLQSPPLSKVRVRVGFFLGDRLPSSPLPLARSGLGWGSSWAIATPPVPSPYQGEG